MAKATFCLRSKFFWRRAFNFQETAIKIGDVIEPDIVANGCYIEISIHQ
jgi:hypothetical protein